MAKGIQIFTLRITDTTNKMTNPDLGASIDQLLYDTGCRAIVLYGEEYTVTNPEVITEAQSQGAIPETIFEAIITNVAISFIDPNIYTATEIFNLWNGMQAQIANWYELYPIGKVKKPAGKGQLTTSLDNWIQGAQVTKIKHISKL